MGFVALVAGLLLPGTLKSFIMKSKITILAACSLLFLSNKEALAQTNYRVNAYYNMSYDGGQFIKVEDSLRVYFQGNHSFADVAETNGMDLPEYLLNMYNGELPLPTFPERYSSVSLPCDSSLGFSVNAAATAFTDESSRTVGSIDASGNITELISREKSGGAWENSTRETYTYANGQITQYIGQNWESGAWKNSDKEVSVYNSAGQLEEFTSFYWSSGAWENSAKHLYQYDANGNCTAAIYKSPDGSGWKNETRVTISYDANDHPETYLFEEWLSGAWEDNSRATISYNSNGDMLVILSQTYTGSTWTDAFRQSYTYNGTKKTECMQETFDGATWNKVTKSIYNYSSSGKLENITVQQWDNAASNWGNKYRLVTEYNSQQLISAVLGEEWNIGGYWEKTTSSFKYKFFYESYVNTGIANLTNEAKLNIYPNPASTALNITIEWEKPATGSLAVYDISGRACISKTLAKEAHTQMQIDISTLTNGSYYLKIATADGQITKAFQVVK